MDYDNIENFDKYFWNSGGKVKIYYVDDEAETKYFQNTYSCVVMSDFIEDIEKTTGKKIYRVDVGNMLFKDGKIVDFNLEVRFFLNSAILKYRNWKDKNDENNIKFNEIKKNTANKLWYPLDEKIIMKYDFSKIYGFYNFCKDIVYDENRKIIAKDEIRLGKFFNIY